MVRMQIIIEFVIMVESAVIATDITMMSTTKLFIITTIDFSLNFG